MAIQNPGKIIVLDAAKNASVKVRLFGEMDLVGATSSYFSSIEDISLVSQNPASAGLELENQVTFNIQPTGAFPVSVNGVELLDSAGTSVLFRTNFSNPFIYGEVGTFTLTQYNISVD